jgi:hypothetical protein
MKRFLSFNLLVLAFLTVRALAQGPNDLNAGSQLSYSGSSGGFNFSWWGVSGNTYLIKVSDDLVNWSFLPVVESGSNAVIEWGISSSSSTLFLGLEYITVPPNELSGASFNGPPDPSGNGLPEDWELFFLGSLGVDPNAYVAWSGSQVTLLEAYDTGLNPIDFYSGQTPNLTIVSGDGQTGSPGGFVSAPLVVSVTDSNGDPSMTLPSRSQSLREPAALCKPPAQAPPFPPSPCWRTRTARRPSISSFRRSRAAPARSRSRRVRRGSRSKTYLTNSQTTTAAAIFHPSRRRMLSAR